MREKLIAAIWIVIGLVVVICLLWLNDEFRSWQKAREYEKVIEMLKEDAS